MKRILVLGCGGAGKSTFSKELHKKLGYELIHLDCHFWLPGWEMIEKEKFDSMLDDFVSREEWIMDGNYSRTIDKRLDRADTVVYFDFPRWRCLYNAVMRMVKGKLFKKERSDITAGCEEKFDMEFYRWIWNFNKNNRAGNIARLEQVKESKKVYIVRNYRQKRELLETICRI
ncbi:MAG TPA: topology modulation protein [Clostridiales bacterium]|nr:topology modulation protein [Clostridiales bacterium]